MRESWYKHGKTLFRLMYFKNALVIILFVPFLYQNLSAQNVRALEIGAMAGKTYYMGDLNLANHFYSTHLALGVFAKYHFNSRLILRGGAFYTNISARDRDFASAFQQQRDHEFETGLIELSAQVEFNFKRFIIGQTRKEAFSPYLQTGLVFYVAPHSVQNIGFALPIGMGIKKNISPRMVLGAEWAFRRTFSDLLDNITGEDIRNNYDPSFTVPESDFESGRQHAFRYTNDWYIYAGVTLTYAFKVGGLGCPAYYDRH